MNLENCQHGVIERTCTKCAQHAPRTNTKMPVLKLARSTAGGWSILGAENADRPNIVRAVNCHEELLEAAKQVVYELQARFMRTGCNVNEEIAMRKMRAAIAKAEEVK